MGSLGNLIIDNRPNGLPHAVNYYETFREEVSPLGPINFATRFTTLMGAETSLEFLLEILLRLAPDAVVVLVCHALQGGLLMPIVRRGANAFAVSDNLRTINRSIEIEAEADRIRHLPTSTQAEKNTQLSKWSDLCNSLQPGCLTGTFSVQEAEQKYGELFEVRAKALEFPADGSKSRSPAFRAFLAKLLAVRKQNRARFEVRACNIGKDQPGLNFVRTFFNFQKMVVPDVETFFMSSLPISVAGRPSGSRQRGGGVRAGAAPGPLGVPNPADIAGIKRRFARKDRRTRGFVKLTIPGAAAGADPVFAVTISIDEPTAFHFVGEGAVISTGDLATPDWLKVKEFLKTSIDPLPVWSSGPFPLAGFWTFNDTPNMPFLLPRDPDYLKHLIVSPPTKP